MIRMMAIAGVYVGVRNLWKLPLTSVPLAIWATDQWFAAASVSWVGIIRNTKP